MNTFKRLSIHILLWSFIWFILWVTQKFNTKFIFENLVTLVFQSVLIVWLLYFAAPKLLFKKKYVLFITISVCFIVGSAYIISNIFSTHKIPIEILDHSPRRPPSKLFVNSLLIGTSYTLAIIVELFLFAQLKEKEAIRIKNENLQNELKLLKSQINPHFLFNTLNNIYALSSIDSNKTQESINYLSNMLRYVLYECERPFVPIEKEIDYIKDYIKLFSLKSSKNYPIKTAFNISNPNMLIAPMLLIPFLENAFKHSNIERTSKSFLEIAIDTNPNGIKFKIENSIPDTEINKDEIGGIGIENVKKRLAILYPKNHELVVTKQNNKFIVELNLKNND